jgi:DNA-binding LacI/PurR family transcriptional regulator
MATIKDVAKASGVSSATVSYVMNGQGGVGEETRRRVLDAVRELNYHPNAVARGLLTRRMNTLGVVFANMEDSPIMNPYFGPVLDGIVAVAKKRHQNTTLFTGDTESEVGRNVPIYCDGRCDGLLVIAPMQGTDLIGALVDRQFPFVVVSESFDHPGVSCVNIDDRESARTLVNHLLDQGHQRIAMVGGYMGARCTPLRILGYREALAAAGVPFDERLVQPGTFHPDTAAPCVEYLMSLPAASRPTALFCANDELAVASIAALHRLGFHVPSDVSVAGFDDISAAATAIPPVTTMRQPLHLLGERAVEMLLDQLDGASPAGRKELLPTQLVVRLSVSQVRRRDEARYALAGAR